MIRGWCKSCKEMTYGHCDCWDKEAKVWGEPFLAKAMKIIARVRKLERTMPLPYLMWDRERKLRAFCPECGDPLPFSQGPDGYAAYVGDTFYCKCKGKDADKT